MATLTDALFDASVPRPRGRVRVALLAAAISAVTLVPFGSASIATAQEVSPVPSGEVLPGEPNPPWEDGAIPAEQRSDLVNVVPRTWDYVLVGPDGRTATVYFTNGTPACYALADVQVTTDDRGTRILLHTGEIPGAQACTEEVRLYRTVVVFDDRIITGGSILDLPSGGIGGRS
jgi:hypothetical protein